MHYLFKVFATSDYQVEQIYSFTCLLVYLSTRLLVYSSTCLLVYLSTRQLVKSPNTFITRALGQSCEQLAQHTNIIQSTF